jgi:HEPN domain-containing protein
MLTSFNHLPPSQVQALKQAISAIAISIAPEKIICYGTRTWLTHTWGIVDPVLNSVMNTDYDLLIITKPGIKRREHEILDIVAQHSTQETRIVAIVHSLCAVNEALERGRSFFVDIYKNGILVYDSSEIPLVTPSVCDNAEQLADIQTQWDHHFGLAEKFLEGASYYLTSGNAALAVFMLHQAAEHSCIALVQACLGYRPATHNLDRLLALTENFSAYPSHIFPQASQEEIDLFNTLSKAYSDVRYKANFNVSIEKAGVLRQRVKDLQEIAEKLYKKKIQKLAVDPRQALFHSTILNPKYNHHEEKAS